MTFIRAAAILLALALTACSAHTPQGLPADKAAYAGEWLGKDIYLLITPDGNVSYRRTGAGSNVSIDAPIEAFDGNDFEVGIGPLSTTFHVSKPPYQENGQWKMVVDGTVLTKSPAPNVQPAPVPAPGPGPAVQGTQV